MRGAQLVGVDVGNWCVLWILPQFLILIPDVEIRRQLGLEYRQRSIPLKACFRYFRSVPQPLLAQVLI